MAKYIVSVKDYDNEAATASFPGTDLTAANFDAEVALMATLKTALEAITMGNTVKLTRVANVSPMEDVPASDKDAQRERKWLVRYHDSVTFEKATISLPCADLSFLDPANRGRAEMGDAAEVDAFVTAFEAYVQPPGGNVAVVDEIIHVGRNI